MTALFNAGSTNDEGSRLAEIDEELLFHLRARIEDNRAAGMSEDEAWEDARRRLGSYRSSVEECHELRTAGRMRAAAGMVAAVVLLVAGGWFMTAWKAQALAAQQSVVAERLGALTTAVNQTAVAAATLAESGAQDLETLVTHKGQPVAEANVLLILKTWPNNRYQQQPFHAKTDAAGKAKFDQLIPAAGQFAIHAAVVHDGHALTSEYHLFKAGKRDLKAIKPLKIALADAQVARFRLKDEQGRPLANARVAPASRQAGKSEPHLVYFDAAEPATVTANAEGEVTFSCFAQGDNVQLFVTTEAGGSTQAECTIPKTGDVVEVTVKSSR